MTGKLIRAVLDLKSPKQDFHTFCNVLKIRSVTIDDKHGCNEIEVAYNRKPSRRLNLNARFLLYIHRLSSYLSLSLSLCVCVRVCEWACVLSRGHRCRTTNSVACAGLAAVLMCACLIVITVCVCVCLCVSMQTRPVSLWSSRKISTVEKYAIT